MKVQQEAKKAQASKDDKEKALSKKKKPSKAKPDEAKTKSKKRQNTDETPSQPKKKKAKADAGKKKAGSIKKEEIWQQRFQELVEYKNKFGHCRVPSRRDGDYQKLGRWVETQVRKQGKRALLYCLHSFISYS